MRRDVEPWKRQGWRAQGSSGRFQHLSRTLETRKLAVEGSEGTKPSSSSFYVGPARCGFYQGSLLCPEVLGGCQMGLIISPLQMGKVSLPQIPILDPR